ncbi:unnamed protein product [Malus baccata var. baccata]
MNSSSMNLNTVEPLTGVNYKKWKQDLEIVLGVMDMDVALRTEEPLLPADEKYKESEKTETGNLMNSLTSIRYDGEGSVCEYILRVIDIAGKLRNLEVPISKTFLVHVIMKSLPDSYTQLKVSYNALQAKWDVNELISICVGEEVRIKKERTEREKIESVNYVQSYTKGNKNYMPDANDRSIFM